MKLPFLSPEDLKPVFVLSAFSETQDWGVKSVLADNFYTISKGENVTIAILDTGYCYHPDIETNIINKFNVTTSPTVDDNAGHACHVAGIIAADDNGIGVMGVAPNSKIIQIKVLDDDGHGTYEWITKGIKLAIELKVDIINLSLGIPIAPPEILHDAIKEAYNNNILIIAASGNDYNNVNYPAAYDEVVAVAALDKNNKLTDFTSKGKELDFAAPGINIYSTYKNQSYAQLDGSSQATPIITGVCALILSREKQKGLITSPIEIMDILKRMSNQEETIIDTANNFKVYIPKFANKEFYNF